MAPRERTASTLGVVIVGSTVHAGCDSLLVLCVIVGAIVGVSARLESVTLTCQGNERFHLLGWKAVACTLCNDGRLSCIEGDVVPRLKATEADRVVGAVNTAHLVLAPVPRLRLSIDDEGRLHASRRICVEIGKP